jgi:hypothetical protein
MSVVETDLEEALQVAAVLDIEIRGEVDVFVVGHAAGFHNTADAVYSDQLQETAAQDSLEWVSAVYFHIDCFGDMHSYSY